MRKHPSDWVSSRKPIEVRVAAVVCVIIALATGKAVSTTFKALYPTYAEQVKMDKTEFCQTHYNNFMKTGTVSDRHPRFVPVPAAHGLTHLVPESVRDPRLYQRLQQDRRLQALLISVQHEEAPIPHMMMMT
jgi:hypothetical protein